MNNFKKLLIVFSLIIIFSSTAFASIDRAYLPDRMTPGDTFDPLRVRIEWDEDSCYSRFSLAWKLAYDYPTVLVNNTIYTNSNCHDERDLVTLNFNNVGTSNIPDSWCGEIVRLALTHHYDTDGDGAVDTVNHGHSSETVTIDCGSPPACNSDSDCGSDGYRGSRFCRDGDVYQEYREYDCRNPGTSSAYCTDSDSDRRRETCSYGCSSGTCDAPPTIVCSSNSDCGSSGYTGSRFCSGGNVYQSYITHTCSNPGTSSSSCSSSTSNRLRDNCSGHGCSSGVCNSPPTSCHTSSLGSMSYCSASCKCDAGEGDCDRDSHCNAGLVCVNNVGASYGWSSGVDVCEAPDSGDCHSGSLGGWSYCSASCRCDAGEGDCDGDSQCNAGLVCVNNVGADYGWSSTKDVCEVPDPESCHSGSVGSGSYCSASCKCDAGEGDCDRDSHCNAGLVCAMNVGASYGWSSGTDVCEAPSIACSSNSDCGSNGYTGSRFCSSGDVYQSYRTYTCSNPGTPSSSCSSSTSNRRIQSCAHGCSSGTCDPAPACSSDSDCGSSGYTGSNFCSGDNVHRNYRTYTCSNPGTPSASCSSSDSFRLIQDCSHGCSSGVCNSPPACSSASDCGSDGYTGSNFCSSGNVYRNYRTYTCSNPGTSSAFCSNNDSARLVDDCSGHGCSSGTCNDPPTSCHSSVLGSYSYCNASCPCDAGEGDCDRDSHCNPGLVCADNVGADYGFRRDLDVCEAPAPACSGGWACKTDFIKDVQNIDCSWSGLEQWCPQGCLSGNCIIQCNSNSDCGNTGSVGEAFCDPTINPNKVYRGREEATCNNSETDFAYCSGISYIEEIRDCGIGICIGGHCIEGASSCHTGVNGDPEYCADACKCGLGEGHCESDNECNAGLVCVNQVGGVYGFSESTSLCMQQVAFDEVFPEETNPIWLAFILGMVRHSGENIPLGDNHYLIPRLDRHNFHPDVLALITAEEPSLSGLRGGPHANIEVQFLSGATRNRLVNLHVIPVQTSSGEVWHLLVDTQSRRVLKLTGATVEELKTAIRNWEYPRPVSSSNWDKVWRRIKLNVPNAKLFNNFAYGALGGFVIDSIIIPEIYQITCQYGVMDCLPGSA